MSTEGMQVARSATEVLVAVQEVKTIASGLCTNFFPDQKKLTAWTRNGDILIERHPGACFFFRNDRRFRHLLFCAADLLSLEAALGTTGNPAGGSLVADLVGREGVTAPLEKALGSAGFKPYNRLLRLSRAAGAEPQGRPKEHAPVIGATTDEVPQVRAFLDSVFDPYRDQLPPAYELHEALAAGQIRAIKCGGEVAALLYSETQGFASTIRFWGVGERWRGQGFGAALMGDYFARNALIRRFVLWVAADNADALQKYRHYGYAADGLTDTILKLN